jgi:alpha-tubulin suppressor-like RCC1 family protein
MSRTVTKSSQSIATGAAQQRRAQVPLARPLLAGIAMAIAVVVGLAAVGVLPRATEASRAEPPPDGILAQVKATTTVQPVASATGTKAVATPALVGARAVASPTPTTWGYRGTTNQPVPAQVPPAVAGLTWKSVSVGFEHTCAIASNDRAYCWGRNDQGQLGDGTTTDRSTPTSVVGVTALRQVSAGYDYTCAVDNDGAAWCWGTFGGMATDQGKRRAVLTPARVFDGYVLESIQVSRTEVCGYVRSTGIVCWGVQSLRASGANQVLREYQESTVPLVVFSGDISSYSITSDRKCAIYKNGNLQCTNYAQTSPRMAAGWKQIAVSEPYFGRNENTSVIAQGFACGIRTDDTTGCLGLNTSGQLGIGIMNSRDYPAGSGNDGGGWSENVLWSDGASFAKQLSVAVNFIDVRVGADYACARTSAGEVWCWGASYAGQLGNGKLADAQPTPSKVLLDKPVSMLSAGYSSTCVVATDGTLWCWGARLGSVELPSAGTNASPVLDIQLKTISGSGAQCGLTRDGVAYCWGRSAYSQNWPWEGREALLTPSRVPVNGTITYIIAAGSETCAIVLNEGLWCWGGSWARPPALVLQGDFVQLGGGPYALNTCVVSGLGSAACGYLNNGFGYVSDPPGSKWITYSAAGTGQSFCGIDRTGRLWCRGSNSFGLNGNNTTSGYSEQSQVDSDNNWKQLMGNNKHRCGLKINGNMYCWGDNSSGQLGNGTQTPSAKPQLVQLPDQVKQISVSGDTSCALLMNNLLYCFGVVSTRSWNISTSPVLISSDNPESVLVIDSVICYLKFEKSFCNVDGYFKVYPPGDYDYIPD